MPHIGVPFFCTPACTRILAAVLLLLTLQGILSSFACSADMDSYPETERMLGTQTDSDCDAGDASELAVWPQAWLLTSWLTALPQEVDLILPRIGGLFVPDTPPPRLA